MNRKKRLHLAMVHAPEIDAAHVVRRAGHLVGLAVAPAGGVARSLVGVLGIVTVLAVAVPLARWF